MDKEINIETIDDVFDNIESEEKAYKFVEYVKNLQNENKQLKERVKDNIVVEISKASDMYNGRVCRKMYPEPHDDFYGLLVCLFDTYNEDLIIRKCNKDDTVTYSILIYDDYIE